MNILNLKVEYYRRMNQSVIIDIGSSEVVVLIGEMGVNRNLNILGKGEVYYAGFQNSEFLEPENLKFVIASAISNAEDMAETKVSEIYVGVPGEFSTAINKNIDLSFPRTKKVSNFDVQNIFKTGNNFKDEEFETVNQSVIYYEIDGKDRVIDPVGLKCQKLRGNISYILARREFINLMKSIFYELRIEIKGFISSVLAECLYLFPPEIRDKYVLLADVGYITTSVALARGNGLLHLSSFSLGGGYITADLAECLKIPFSEAKRLKHKVVLAWNPTDKDTYIVEGTETFSSYSAKATNEIVKDRVEMICDYIKKCIDYSRYSIPNFLPLYITGGGIISMRGARGIISKRVGRQVIKANSQNLQKVREYNSSEEGLLYMTLECEDMLESMIKKV